MLTLPAVKVRLDKLLLHRGLASSRERAQALILAGRVLVNDQKIEKAGTSVEEDVALRLIGEEMRYVSRGGLKLEYAIQHWNLAVEAKIGMDIGASAGGFTDCLLQHGAAAVIAVDTGYGQIDAKLRNDCRVHLLERTNARYLTAADLKVMPARPISFMSMDVSFISATLVLPAVITSIREHNQQVGAAYTRMEAVVLVKPQFEVGRELVGKGGIVRDAGAQQFAVEKVDKAVISLGAQSTFIADSPILGAEGNREFLLYSQF